MKTLHLTLKRKWFDMILSGEKTEEYRDIKPFWTKRFKPMLSDFQKSGYTSITFSNGYSKNRPQFEIEFKGIFIREGVFHWGAEPDFKYFVLELGEILTTKNINE